MVKKETHLAVGDEVEFLGYSDEAEMSEEDTVLSAGDIGTITEVDIKERAYVLSVSNPDFDDSKRATKNNPKTIEADAFFEEVVLAVGDGELELELEEGEEEEAPQPKAKAKAKVKAKAPSKGRAAPAKKAKAEVAEEEEEVEEEEDRTPKDMVVLEEEDEEILELVEGLSNDELLELAAEKVDEASSAEYIVGGILYHVRLSSAYQDMEGGAYAGKGGFEEYINVELGMEYRKAMWLIDIYYNFNRFGIGADVVKRLGWTKCKEISRVMTEENASALVQAAEEATVSELKETIREDFVGEQGAGRTTAPRRITFKFRLYEDQAALCEQILAQAAASIGNDDLNFVFEHVVTEWANEHLDVQAQQKAKRTAKAKVKAAHAEEEPAEKTTVKKKAVTKKAVTKKAVTKKAVTKKKASLRR